MSEEYTDRFLEVLNSTFLACDEQRTGSVEINKLIDFLISQVPSLQDNEMIREEFHKVLQGDLRSKISKEDFIETLRGWFEESLYQDSEEEKGENNDNEAGKCSSSTSGIGDPSEITSGSSTNSMEDIYFVSDEQTFTNEDSFHEMSFNESKNSAELRLVEVLQSEVSALLRKNDSLLRQVSCFEDALAKKSEESEDLEKELIKKNKYLQMEVQKLEESEEKLSRLTEENKSMSIRTSHAERENAKLKTMVSDFEIKLESSSNENVDKITNLEEMTNKCNTVSELYNNSLKLLEQEREHFKIKEKETENTLREIIEENRNLQSQLDSNTTNTEDIKCKLRAALKELSNIQSARIKHVMKTDNFTTLLSADSSMVFFDENFSLDNTIPFETSLLAELKDEVQSDEKKGECCCVCKQNISLMSNSSDTADDTVAILKIETVDKATMTTFHKPNRFPDVLEESTSSTFHLLKSRRSVQKWFSLFGIIIVLSFLLVFFSFHIVLPPSFKRSHKPIFYLTSFLDLLHVQVKALDTFTPIQ